MNNTAVYGDDIASYPIKIRLRDIDIDDIILSEVVSGQTYSPSLEFELIDHDDQTIVIDSISTIKIGIIDADATDLGGTREVVVKNGRAEFDDISFISKPGSVNVMFSVESESLDQEILHLQYNDTVVQNPIYASFRYCKSGEVESGNPEMCVIWSPGTYSLGWNKTTWISWVSNAVWLGGQEIYVSSGYFRSSLDTDYIIEWIRPDSWKGGFQLDSEYPVQWQTGYKGLLWADWVVNSHEKYEKSFQFVCSKWPNFIMNWIRMGIITLLILAFLTILIMINIRKKSESQVSTLMRILTNYLQIVSTALAFDANYPKSVVDAFQAADVFGSSSESFVSIDCFIQSSEATGFAPNARLFKLFLISLLPVILILLYSLVWVIMKCTPIKLLKDLKRNIVVSTIVILFFLHPALTRSALSVFQ